MKKYLICLFAVMVLIFMPGGTGGADTAYADNPDATGWVQEDGGKEMNTISRRPERSVRSEEE